MAVALQVPVEYSKIGAGTAILITILMTMRPPKIVKPDVVSFCRSIVSGAVPTFVPVSPAPHSKVSECFINVEQQVELQGGKQLIGWAVWQWPRVFIEAEFHSIWQSPNNQLVDITPQRPAIPRILFIHDPRRTYDGQSVDNIRRPLRRNKDIGRFCDLAQNRFKLLNSGELAGQYGEIHMMSNDPIYVKLLEIDRERELVIHRLEQKYGRNSPEPGGHSQEWNKRAA